MQKFIVLFSVLTTALLGILYPHILIGVVVVSLVGLVYLLWQQRQRGFRPQSETYRELEKLKRRRLKSEETKHKHINDQVKYIAEVWGYTKEQERIMERFIEERAYSEMYNKLTASLFPQMITLIDYCNERGQKGCKREVSKRLRELTHLMREELEKKRMLKSESYETSLEVYDQIIKGR